jgi:glyoxylase-like metal-dependent hydrolase (beta-lactamase superfamily II)
VVVEPILAGTLTAARAGIETAKPFPKLRMLGVGSPKVTMPVPAFLIRHPSAGAFLVDTGLHASVAARPAENLGRIVTSAMQPEVEPGADLPAQLRAKGVDPKSIRLVVMTHLHVDHASGMSEFPTATFVFTEAEWKAASTDSRPLLRGYRPAHYDYAFDYRTLNYDSPLISSYATFGRTFDLFGDGSVRLASTPGHSAGHQSVICRLAERDLVIAGDAIYTMGQLGDAPEPPRPLDRHNWRRSMRELQHFARTYPQAIVIAGHDPEQMGLFGKRYE